MSNILEVNDNTMVNNKAINNFTGVQTSGVIIDC